MVVEVSTSSKRNRAHGLGRQTGIRPFSLLVKPASADCNLCCEYCFYLSKCRLYTETQNHRMDDAVLEQVIKTYMKTHQPAYSICWQGGEPTLMGTGFFLKAVELEKKHGFSGARVSNLVQTNATLITDEMAKVFARYKFLVGCSLDGPEKIHDQYRRTNAGKSTHRDVIKGIQTLKRHHVDFNILTLVSRANVDHAKEIYQYLKDMGIFYHQYIPCVEFDEDKTLSPFAISGEEWGYFLCSIFDSWYPKDLYSVSVRNFNSILSKKIDRINDVCVMGDNCCHYFVVEYNGDIFPCDFFVENPQKLGNIMENSWEELLDSRAYLEFGTQKKQLNNRCTSCDYLDLCGGDCLKNRTYKGNPPQTLSWLCPGLHSFFKQTGNRFDKLAAKIREDRQKEQIMIDKTRKFGRNNPCICGSGIKYKKCCGK